MIAATIATTMYILSASQPQWATCCPAHSFPTAGRPYVIQKNCCVACASHTSSKNQIACHHMRAACVPAGTFQAMLALFGPALSQPSEASRLGGAAGRGRASSAATLGEPWEMRYWMCCHRRSMAARLSTPRGMMMSACVFVGAM